jgi:hypothetical protein
MRIEVLKVSRRSGVLLGLAWANLEWPPARLLGPHQVGFGQCQGQASNAAPQAVGLRPHQVGLGQSRGQASNASGRFVGERP